MRMVLALVRVDGDFEVRFSRFHFNGFIAAGQKALQKHHHGHYESKKLHCCKNKPSVANFIAGGWVKRSVIVVLKRLFSTVLIVF